MENEPGGEDLAPPMSLAGHVQKFECRNQGVSFKSAWLGFDQPRPCRLGAKESVDPPPAAIPNENGAYRPWRFRVAVVEWPSASSASSTRPP